MSYKKQKNLRLDKIYYKSDKIFMLCKSLRYGTMILKKGTFFMTNEEYIKSLEARIAILEKAIEHLTNSKILEKAENVTFENCIITSAALTKCRNITLTNNQIETGVFAAFKNKFKNLKTDKVEVVKSRVKFVGCKLNEYAEKDNIK